MILRDFHQKEHTFQGFPGGAVGGSFGLPLRPLRVESSGPDLWKVEQSEQCGRQ